MPIENIKRGAGKITDNTATNAHGICNYMKGDPTLKCIHF